jgi:SAM-dependent methyltransferase
MVQLWHHSGLRSKVSERTGYEKSAHLYDLFDRKENVEFFHHYAAEAGEILDVGAGTGRIAIPLSRRGISVCCVEPSPAMRRQFEANLREEPHLRERITLVEGEATSFDLGRTFPAAFLSGSFDHLFDDEERLSALRNIGRHLSDGGVLVFDVFLGLMKGTPLSPAGVVQAGDREIRRLVGGRMLSNQRKETTLVFEVYEQGELVERIEERSLVGITDRGAIHRLLKMAGFEVYREWGDYDFKPFEEGDSLLIVQAALQPQTLRVFRNP